MRYKLLFLTLLISNVLFAQKTIGPGFDGKEYMTLMKLFGVSKHLDITDVKSAADDYKKVYVAPEVAFKNQWALFVNEKNNTAMISLRGTVEDPKSWAANYYFAMIPAQGTLELNNKKITYKLAEDTAAAVHAGWTIATLAMADDVEEKIKQHYTKGIKEFYIFGHSQGGALCYLMTSHLRYRQKAGALPGDIIFKTYASAPPKPGNLQYAYDYDFITRNGWAFQVVNSKDWVCETPFTVQTVQSLDPKNPIVKTFSGKDANAEMKKIMNDLVSHPMKTQEMYTSFFGNGFYKMQVQKFIPGLKEPKYKNEMNYTPAGIPIILIPDADYYKEFDENNLRHHDPVWLHHEHDAYYFLVKKYYLDKKSN